MTPGGKLQSIQTLLGGQGFKPSRQRSRGGGLTALAGARSKQQSDHYATQCSASNAITGSLPGPALLNFDKTCAVRSTHRQATDDEHSLSIAREQQQHNEKYEKVLA